MINVIATRNKNIAEGEYIESSYICMAEKKVEFGIKYVFKMALTEY